jgi:hypothetical protein
MERLGGNLEIGLIGATLLAERLQWILEDPEG